MRGNPNVNPNAYWTDGEVISLIAAVAFTCALVAWFMFVQPVADAAREEGYKAGVAAQQLTDKAVEEAAMKWWSGSPDLIGARERLCKNYYTPKGKK